MNTFVTPPPKKKYREWIWKMSIIIKLQVGLGFFFICNSAKLYFNPETYITLVYTSLFNLIGMFYRNKLILIKFTLLFIVKYHNDRNKHLELLRRGTFERSFIKLYIKSVLLGISWTILQSQIIFNTKLKEKVIFFRH